MTSREKTAVIVAAILTVVITSYSYIVLVGTGTLSWHIRQPETKQMMLELLLLWLLLFLSFFRGIEKKRSQAAVAVLVVGFCWIHELLLPALVTGIYVGYLIAVGRWIQWRIRKESQDIAWDFCLGSIGTILVICVLSLLHVGSIRNIRIWVVGTGLLLAAVYLIQAKKSGIFRLMEGQRKCYSWQQAAMMAAILVLLLLQAGRINVAVDFDSIWYGVRSSFMLNSGNGIYENLGTLGVVYTYPKGWETLTLPVSGLPSYSFPIAFNVWVAALVLYSAYKTARLAVSRDHALWGPFLMAAVPGIMNMTATAKADMLTLLFQILMIQAVLRFIKDRNIEWLLSGLSAAGISLTMKPTAVVFSSAIVGITGVWLILTGRKKLWLGVENRIYPSGWIPVLLAAAALAGIWGRTIKLVGVPVTSVFYQVFQAIGFRVKYPFYASGFPAAGDSMSLGEMVRFFLKRLYGVLLNPQGNDMAHVIIAWGTLFPLIFIVLAFLLRNQRHQEERDWTLGYLKLLLTGIVLINLVSLYSLYQIDGNYYILFYTIMILTGIIWLERRTDDQRRSGGRILMIPWLFAVVLCCITNWSWTLGLSPVRLMNRGYYNHEQKFREESRDALGCEQIWNELAADSKNRVIALGEHPRVLTFPCSVQSYVDVSGYWGNPEVVADAPSFLNYLHYAEIDYIYMEREYVDTSVRIYQIIRTLIEEGWIYDVRDESGNLIIRIAHKKPEAENITENLDVFDARYIQHP